MRIGAVRVKEPGRVFRVDEVGLTVTDELTMDVIEVEPHALMMSLGGDDTVGFDFCLMESCRVMHVDGLDAAILEMASAEIA